MEFFGQYWKQLRDALFRDAPDDAAFREAREGAAAVAPVIWLLGKTGAGKSSIIAALTGADRAEIGNGFEPCTRTAEVYDFPQGAPVVRFLDTRGLGESRYDPAEDIAWCEGQSHVVVAVARIDDPAQQTILDALAAARRRHPGWPVIVAQTCLHRALAPGEDLPSPDPFTGTDADGKLEGIPHPLRQALMAQRRAFARVLGTAAVRFVPLDLTRPGEGYANPEYGLDRLHAALEAVLPHTAEYLARKELDREADRVAARARTLILGYAGAAAGAGAVPVPLVGIAGVTGIQGFMLRALARRYGVEWTPARFAEFTGALGTGALLGAGVLFGARELLKLVPFLNAAAIALNGATAFGLTAGLGFAVCEYLGSLKAGQHIDKEAIRNRFKEGLRRRQARPDALPEAQP